jgi:hypothetical protein
MKLTKNSSEEVLIRVGWFVSLKSIADRYEKKPTKENLSMLLGFISSAEFVVNNLVNVEEQSKEQGWCEVCKAGLNLPTSKWE